ncbi:hypothetical protein GCK72_000150 [Caenorhabditis remanei]|uniref:Glycosyltransferase 2-like domain-containing protein n=1 Tax=Caenorhabditis remanei TaxID=31234 RepID=A0A6A5HKD3_CAERE|nr:hypothetical protein GCK72_000150 [Caenorhabditis remanei]KAF1768338.1 hypothetical protein GCK72_000150 [Caenorhabditis remanei]
MYEYDVSVIIPARNAEKFLRETLNGLLAQTAVENARIEICLADDGSLDDTVRILENSRLEFEELGMKVVVSHVSQPGGVGAAKDCAVRSSRGRYLCFNDADDVSTPDRIRCQLEMARRLSKSSDDLVFVPEDVVMYRYHPDCASHSVTEQTIWNFRLKRLKEQYIAKWDKFTIWSAGKQGKRLFKCLDDDEKLKVREFCDIDESKIGRGIHEEFDEKQRIVTHKVPIVNIETAKPPLIVCVKLDLTHGDLERIIERKKWREHVDLVYFG